MIDEPKKSAATILAELALDNFQPAITPDGRPYAVPIDQDAHRVRMLRGDKHGLRAELAQMFYKQQGKAAPQQALADALMVIEGYCHNTDPVPVHLRVAEHGEVTYVDLGDAAANVITLRAGSWDVHSGQDSPIPVRFQRTALTGAFPQPQRGGDINELWRFINIAEPDRPLALSFLTASLIAPSIPHPILSLLAEQGSGKSSASRILVALTDPSPVPVRKPPKDLETWVTAAQGSWVVALDNLSKIPEWLSDSLCRASTGDGDVRRALYSDGGLAVFGFRRCVIINGIDVGAIAGDLAERSLTAELRRIPREKRLDEKALDAAWLDAYPRILGALLDAACAVKAVLPSVELASKPRMADFALIVAAVDQVFGTQGLPRYLEQMENMAADSLSADPFLTELLHLPAATFSGVAAELLTAVTPSEDGWKPPYGWPKSPRAVTSLLKRNAPALRQLGWTVELTQDRHARRAVWQITPPADALRRRPGFFSASPHDQQTAGQSMRTKCGEDADMRIGSPPADKPRTTLSASPHDIRTEKPPLTRDLRTCGESGEVSEQSQDEHTSCEVCSQTIMLADPARPGLCSRCRGAQPAYIKGRPA